MTKEQLSVDIVAIASKIPLHCCDLMLWRHRARIRLSCLWVVSGVIFMADRLLVVVDGLAI